ncbi:hypothetical protein ASG67_11610 [Sphingomonas sp. Leaf339]|uniref:FecR family protein n=1 Tax=Sphingomonas sp. Leaf339 TaxID=1736343 RepID=UPI0006F1DE87|nr:FecR domain-containing protein [Sphingomonas sp. Leaf339]KQU49743.1 hypothetical protein ASG67_11610 [Sphingomonas sp. Leaf339]
MSGPDLSDDLRRDAGGTAARWYARLRADDVTDTDRLAMRRWHAADPANARAWDAVSQVDGRLSAMRDDPAMRAMRDRMRPHAYAKSALPWRSYAAAAAIMLTVGTSATWLIAGRAPPVREERIASATGQMRHLRLSDGSVMTLDTASTAMVQAPGDERRVTLQQGRALFAVAKDAVHPFIVSAGDNTVTAVGTEFSVELAPNGMTVALIEGSVRVASPDATRLLSPGDVLTIANGHGTVRAGAATIDTEWRNGTLTFDAMPLGEVAAQLNRYTKRQIVIGDPALARRPFSGVLLTRDGADALVAALDAYGTARVARTTRDQIVLMPQ